MIHTYSLNGRHFVLDVNSGAVHQADALFARLCRALEPLAPQLPDACPPSVLEALGADYPAADIAEAYGEALELFHVEQLFSADGYDLFREKMGLSPVKAMCLNVSHDCNLRCVYCFAGKGDYSQGRMVMSAETGKKAIDYLIGHSGDREFLEVDFFGGEPLLNFGVVKEVVAYARSLEGRHGKTFRFTITTNGLLLDADMMEFINREMSNVVLSIDGRKQVHDRVRARVDGSGCYDAVLPKFRQLVAGRGDKEYYVRGTFTRHNLDFAEDVLAMRDAGFDQVSIEPVVANPKEPWALTEEDLPAIGQEYERLGELLYQSRKQGNFVNFFHFMLDLDQGPCAIKRLRGCGCGNEYLAVTPDGDVYPCHQFIGHEGWRMGSVHDGSLDLSLKERFSRTTVYEKGDCRDCWAKFYCSGGCNANNMIYQGDILKSHRFSCELEKKRLECAIALQARELEDAGTARP
ncbi:thioether cross-link-forming SCIFF peptide maturase [Bacteroides sp. OttesenSCG-928-J23]|nr:thioether cross-link-forming SCIFF peptide maturase [Bacteroides sp. OttesenSCG-928-J23]